jgi:hypothetical protein
MLRICFASATLLATGLSQAALPRDLDGAWYSPAQSGHGLTIERIDADSAVILWHVYDPEGSPLTLYIEAEVEGNTMQGEAFAPRGMRFGEFDPASVSLPSWGSVTLSFSDCATGTLSYQSSQTDYGSGSAPIARLLPLRNAHCSLDWPSSTSEFVGHRVFGYLSRTPLSSNGDGWSSQSLQGYVRGPVDREGQLWLGSEPSTDHFAQGFAIIGEPRPAPAGEAHFVARVRANGWLNPYLPPLNEQVFPADRVWSLELPLSLRRDGLRGTLSETLATGWYGQLQPSSQGTFPLRAGRYAFSVTAHRTPLPTSFRAGS